MKNLAFILFVALNLMVSPFWADAASIRCGVRLITIGDFKDRVLAECGQPDHVEVWEEEQVYRFRHHPRYYGVPDNYDYLDPRQEGSPYRVRRLVIVEQWTYNHGPTRFQDHLRLENGIVRSIISGDYGY